MEPQQGRYEAAELGKEAAPLRGFTRCLARDHESNATDYLNCQHYWDGAGWSRFAVRAWGAPQAHRASVTASK